MKVLVSDNLGEVGIRMFEDEDGLSVDVKTGLSPEELESIIGEYHALVLLAIIGMMFMAAATHLMLMFLALETMSIAVYALVKKSVLDPANNGSNSATSCKSVTPSSCAKGGR